MVAKTERPECRMHSIYNKIWGVYTFEVVLKFLVFAGRGKDTSPAYFYRFAFTVPGRKFEILFQSCYAANRLLQL